jgi:NADH-quinone oxidoreductase subunit K
MGQVFAVFIITLAAIAATVGLAIVLALYRVRRTVYTDEVNLLKW